MYFQVFQHFEKMESLEVAIAKLRIVDFPDSRPWSYSFSQAFISQWFHLNARAIHP